jgi:holin-like protein
MFRTSKPWFRRQAIIWRRSFRTSAWLQILLLLGFWQAGEAVVRLTGLPLPGAVIGLFLVLTLLANHWFSPASLQRGSRWFLARLVLFLLPSVLSLLDHPEFLGLLGLKILAAILLGTLSVMVVTALVVDLCYRRILSPKANAYASR